MENVQWWAVRVPKRLITDASLPVTAKALYMTLMNNIDPETLTCLKPRAALAAEAGFRSARTLDAYIHHLAAAGKIEPPERGRRPLLIRLRPLSGEVTIKLPGMLVSQPGLRPTAKCVYAVVLALRDARTGIYQGRQSELLGHLELRDAMALKTAVTQLQQAGWLRLRSKSGAGGRKYEPLDPHLQLRETVRDRVLARLNRKERERTHGHQDRVHIGEKLMQAMLTECIADQSFEDNARRSKINNPLTGEPLEFDRLYDGANVAIEFNGPQHYTTTEMFPDPDEVFKQQARDLMKEAQANRNGIRLVIIQPHELSFAQLTAKLRGVLPVRQLRWEDPVVRTLDRISRAYRRKL